MKIIKRIFTFCLIIFSFSKANSSCARDGISVFPKSNNIYTNSIILIEGYAESQTIIKELGKNNPVYLKNGRNKIKLLVKEILIGQFNLTQAILVPERNLKKDREYLLVIENLPRGEKLERWNSALGKLEPIVYKVNNSLDTLAPKFATIPKEIRKTYINYGCGPSVNVEFECKVIEDHDFLIEAILKDLGTGKELKYYFKSEKEILEIGHGMCSGAYLFSNSENYEIELSLIDFSSNRTNWKGDRLKFTKPREENSIRKPR